MKTKLFINLFFLVLAISVSAGVFDTPKEIKLRRDEKANKVLRSLPILPVSAYLNGSTIYIDFLQDVEVVSVSVVNVDTDEVIYFDNQSGAQNTSVSLNGEESGVYRLEIETGDGVIWGEFGYDE